MKTVVALLSFLSFSLASAITPSQLVQIVMQKTDLYAEGSAACDDAENTLRRITYPQNPKGLTKFIKTYKYTSDSIFGVMAKSEIERAVSSFSDLRWTGASWNPWRTIDTIGIDELRPYMFYVEVIEPEYDEIDTIDFTSVCITVVALKSS
ncbi:hypothetical protein [Deinococcus sp. Leaf326]|uniref:hypothetical protein n=1 Tax=Deinococcus sp. Leaf326 TaxID=1736338 RepID=UPI0006FF5E45|nr:hypothetical protein [Deinococcus sp. Leaf326]KQR08826.1 hypothetical protein ASF71_09965 [Deinococcus sp. Leaf326]